MFIEIVKYATGEVVKRIGPVSHHMADRVESGSLINLNRNDYFTRQVEE